MKNNQENMDFEFKCEDDSHTHFGIYQNSTIYNVMKKNRKTNNLHPPPF